jgi:K+-transporting ATPase KdpF subunit
MMTLVYVLGAIFAVVVLVYLIAALLAPEKF